MRHYADMILLTTNLGVRSSNLFGRANKINHLGAYRKLLGTYRYFNPVEWTRDAGAEKGAPGGDEMTITQITDTIKYRTPTENDWDSLYTALNAAAPDIPLSLVTPTEQAKMWAVIGERAPSGYSWVASKGDTIIGVALARPDVYEDKGVKKGGIYLDYITVDSGLRNKNVCTNLMSKLKTRGLVITADVLYGNRSSMVDILTHFGFEKVESDDKKTRLRWSPTMAENAEKKR
jgi:hypothetical protein